MVCFQTQNPNLGSFWTALEWKMFLYFMITWNVLWPFGIHNLWQFGIGCGHLAYFSHFGMFGPGKIWQPCSDQMVPRTCKSPSLTYLSGMLPDQKPLAVVLHGVPGKRGFNVIIPLSVENHLLGDEGDG
jgi:hypothetical protein